MGFFAKTLRAGPEPGGDPGAGWRNARDPGWCHRCTIGRLRECKVRARWSEASLRNAAKQEGGDLVPTSTQATGPPGNRDASHIRARLAGEFAGSARGNKHS